MNKQREMFEAWQIESGRTDPMWLAYNDEEKSYSLNDVQAEWSAWQAAIAAQWQPIDVEPKDGQVCVVYDPCNETLKVWPAQYDAKNKSFTAGSHGAAGWFEYGEVTHWMPLPPEPTK